MKEIRYPTFRQETPSDMAKILVLMADGKWYSGEYYKYHGYDGIVYFDNDDEMEVDEYPDFQWAYAQS